MHNHKSRFSRTQTHKFGYRNAPSQNSEPFSRKIDAPKAISDLNNLDKKSWHYNMSDPEKQFLRKDQIEVQDMLDHVANDPKYKQNLGQVDMRKYIGNPVV